MTCAPGFRSQLERFWRGLKEEPTARFASGSGLETLFFAYSLFLPSPEAQIVFLVVVEVVDIGLIRFVAMVNIQETIARLLRERKGLL